MLIDLALIIERNPENGAGSQRSARLIRSHFRHRRARQPQSQRGGGNTERTRKQQAGQAKQHYQTSICQVHHSFFLSSAMRRS
jgi:hypothetical protein